MARSSSRSRRDTFAYDYIANDRSLPRSLSPSNYSYTFRPSLSVYEDRRFWNPEGSNAPARSFSQSRHRLIVVDRERRPPLNLDRFSSLRKFPSQTKGIVAFEAPRNVLICVRRRIRSEVMHALGHAGRGGQRMPHHNVYSQVSCKE